MREKIEGWLSTVREIEVLLFCAMAAWASYFFDGRSQAASLPLYREATRHVAFEAWASITTSIALLLLFSLVTNAVGARRFTLILSMVVWAFSAWELLPHHGAARLWGTMSVVFLLASVWAALIVGTRLERRETEY